MSQKYNFSPDILGVVKVGLKLSNVEFFLRILCAGW